LEVGLGLGLPLGDARALLLGLLHRRLELALVGLVLRGQLAELLLALGDRLLALGPLRPLALLERGQLLGEALARLLELVGLPLVLLLGVALVLGRRALARLLELRRRLLGLARVLVLLALPGRLGGAALLVERLALLGELGLHRLRGLGVPLEERGQGVRPHLDLVQRLELLDERRGLAAQPMQRGRLGRQLALQRARRLADARRERLQPRHDVGDRQLLAVGRRTARDQGRRAGDRRRLAILARL